MQEGNVHHSKVRESKPNLKNINNIKELYKWFKFNLKAVFLLSQYKNTES